MTCWSFIHSALASFADLSPGGAGKKREKFYRVDPVYEGQSEQSDEADPRSDGGRSKASGRIHRGITAGDQ